MTNIFTIFRKELNSYFNSPIAYLVMSFFGILAGYFFYVYVAFFVERSTQSQMMGRSMPMDVNEMVIRQLLANLAVIGLFMIPMITMRLFAEEKRSGTIELLTTSPVRDSEVILGKWLAALALYIAVLGISALSIASLFLYGKPDVTPILTGYLGLILQGGSLLAIGTFISTLTRNQIIAAFATFAVSLLLWVLGCRECGGIGPVGESSRVPLSPVSRRVLRQRSHRHKGRGLLRVTDVLRTILDRAISRIPEVEGLDEDQLVECPSNPVYGFRHRIHRRRHRSPWTGKLARRPPQQVH